MVGHGILQRVHLGERGSEYELAHGKPQHAHLYCLDCGRLEDYPMPELERLPARVRKQEGFEAAHLLMRVCGYCRRCRRTRARTAPHTKRRS
jgi:Fur family ferric uptake transcriptional regulator